MKKYFKNLLCSWAMAHEMFLLFILYFIYGLIPCKFILSISNDIILTCGKIMGGKNGND
jgi:hypothetical protein